MLIGLTGGQLAWDGARGGFDPAQSTALPPATLDWPGAEPLWVDQDLAMIEVDVGPSE